MGCQKNCGNLKKAIEKFGKNKQAGEISITVKKADKVTLEVGKVKQKINRNILQYLWQSKISYAGGQRNSFEGKDDTQKDVEKNINFQYVIYFR